MLGLLQWLQQAMAAAGPFKTERVHLVWASQHAEDFGMLPESLLSESECALCCAERWLPEARSSQSSCSCDVPALLGLCGQVPGCGRQPAGQACSCCALSRRVLRRRPNSWLRLSLYSTRSGLRGAQSGGKQLQGKLSSKSDDPLLDTGKLPQLTFAGQAELGAGPHARQHAAFVAKRTGPFYLSPRHAPAPSVLQLQLKGGSSQTPGQRAGSATSIMPCV